MTAWTRGADTASCLRSLSSGDQPPGSYRFEADAAATALTQIYLHVDLALKERALARTAPPNTAPGRYRPPDQLLAFLESL
jgi:hypothetical protein